MQNAKRISIVIVGTIFLLSGLGKIGNVLSFQYLIHSYGLGIANILAPFIILMEILLGTLLILDVYSKRISLVSIMVLLIFTATYTYAWLQHGITDCGCFGRFLPIPSSPLITYVRNLIMIMLLLFSFHTANADNHIPAWKYTIILTIMFSATFVAGMTYRPFSFMERKHPMEGKTLSQLKLSSLSTFYKRQIVFFYSYSCSHCLNSVENLLAIQEYHAADTIFPIGIVKDMSYKEDSAQLIWHDRYPQFTKTMVQSELQDIQVYPTTLIIKEDTIKKVWEGELPSPFTIAGFFDNY